MGLRCSLAGHDWGESEIERDRDEQGSEVVLTVREYEVCTHCDERNLISENTEVTTLAGGEEDEPPGRAPEPTRDGSDAEDAAATADDAGDGSAAGGASADDAGDVDGSATADSAGDEQVSPEASAAEIIGDDTGVAADDGVEGATGDDPTVSVADARTVDDAEASVDDAVFIDDAEDGDVEAVEDTVAAAEEPVDDAAPDPHGEAAPGATGATDAAESSADDDGVILDDDADADDDRGHGEWPDGPDGAGDRATEPGGAAGEVSGDAAAGQFQEEPAPEGDGYDAEFIDGDEPATADSTGTATSAEVSPSGIKSAGSTAPPGQRHQRTGELVCPNCQNAESAERTSLRAGDICPECRKGYLSNPDE